MNNFGQTSNLLKKQWVEKFKDVFIHQKKDELHILFDLNHFGLHNGSHFQDYIDYEFEEFKIKCANFGLTPQADVVCYDLKDDFFYFALGKKEDRALFEAIFRWHEDKAIGNQYFFKIEPKIQFFKTISTQESLSQKRKINVKPVNQLQVKKIINREPGEEHILVSNELPAHLGGNFYSSIYERIDEDSLTYWDKLQIVTDQGIIKQDVLMRGIDHPLFQPNLYPHVSQDRKSFQYDAKLHPVVVYVLLDSGKEMFYKYPQNNVFEFDELIQSVCLTDTLSYDWIVNFNG